MAAELDLEMHQIDIKGAYLNGKLTSEEQISMKQPPGILHQIPKGSLSPIKNPLQPEAIQMTVVPETGNHHGRTGF
jgi:hypothetical protein